MILALVDRIESGVAVLELEDGHVLMVPAAELPAGVVEGEPVEVRLERVAASGAHLPPIAPD